MRTPGITSAPKAASTNTGFNQARDDALQAVGCLAYEVGVSDDEPDTVFVVELWESAHAHQASLALPEVKAAIAAARPLLSGSFGGFRFEVVGSPLRR